MTPKGAELDEITFVQFALTQANAFDEATGRQIVRCARSDEFVEQGIARLHPQ